MTHGAVNFCKHLRLRQVSLCVMWLCICMTCGLQNVAVGGLSWRPSSLVQSSWWEVTSCVMQCVWTRFFHRRVTGMRMMNVNFLSLRMNRLPFRWVMIVPAPFCWMLMERVHVLSMHGGLSLVHALAVADPKDLQKAALPRKVCLVSSLEVPWQLMDPFIIVIFIPVNLPPWLVWTLFSISTMTWNWVCVPWVRLPALSNQHGSLVKLLVALTSSNLV